MEKELKISKKNDKSQLIMTLVIIAVVLTLFNQIQLMSMDSSTIPTGLTVASASSVMPTGVPEGYGKELGINYDDVSPNDPGLADQTIRVMGNLDRTLTLEGNDLDRYIKTVSEISCEYCCGAKSIIFNDGKPACGCAHSYAMRGLAKYLILNHPEYSDGDILEELAKWKTLFFPTQMQAKADVLKQNGIEFSYTNLGSNAYRGIEKGASGGGMVGGC